MLDLALKTSEDHPLEKSVLQTEERYRPVAIWAFSNFSWLQQCEYVCFPPYVWNLLLFKAVIEHAHEPKPCGWPEAFDHFMMDVFQPRGFAVFEEK